MNTTKIHKNNTALEIALSKSFNLHIKEVIESRISSEIDTIHMDFTNCHILDSEAVIFMYKWQKAGNKLMLQNPPEILFNIITILELDEDWNLHYIKSKE
ncbi:MAG: hypothetical protein U5J95_11205 [Balneolaceae bacterium]|nr:hypothetical protein [Balneolaceae bacterium]